MSVESIPVTFAVISVTDANPANVFRAASLVASAAIVPRLIVIALPVPVALVNVFESKILDPAISSRAMVSLEPSALASSINLFNLVTSPAAVIVIVASVSTVSCTVISGAVVLANEVVKSDFPDAVSPLNAIKLSRLSLRPLSEIFTLVLAAIAAS